MNTVELPSHRHPLKPIDDEDQKSKVCGLCGETIQAGPGYECSQCNFTAHRGCAENPPPLVIENIKTHEHPLTLLPRHVAFTCNACGFSGDKSPYVCLICSFMIHKHCIGLPRVIRLIRHQYHRLSHTWFLGLGEWNCGVCRGKIDGKHGAYKCLRCQEDYAVHLRCALREDVWDGKDLEEVPEDYDGEEESPFAPIGDKLIKHFSHEHYMKLVNQDARDDSVRCSGCAFPITSDPFYKCTECDYVLDEKCANLPLKTTTFLHRHPLTLCTNDDPRNLPKCRACHLPFNGFKYRCLDPSCKDIKFDVRCCSVTEPFLYQLHSHPLYSNLTEPHSTCSVCHYRGDNYVLGCVECEFKLCLACATLPAEVVYKYDEHLLSLTIGEGVTTNPNWCDACETKIDGTQTSYKCSDCGPVLHENCVLGSLRNVRLGSFLITPNGNEYKVILNDRTSRLYCDNCRSLCHGPLLLMATSTTDVTIATICSYCFFSLVNLRFY